MDQRNELDAKLAAVNDPASLLEFVRALIADRESSVAQERQSPSSPYGAAARGWENISIEAYLDAATAWAEATDFGAARLSGHGPWRRFAEFLYAGKVYE